MSERSRYIYIYIFQAHTTSLVKWKSLDAYQLVQYGCWIFRKFVFVKINGMFLNAFKGITVKWRSVVMQPPYSCTVSLGTQFLQRFSWKETHGQYRFCNFMKFVYKKIDFMKFLHHLLISKVLEDPKFWGLPRFLFLCSYSCTYISIHALYASLLETKFENIFFINVDAVETLLVLISQAHWGD